MNSPFPVPDRPRGIAEQLAALGLGIEPFDRAAREHLAAYFGCTQHDPPTFPPTSAWAAGNRSLRDQLAPRWTAKNERNQPLVINEAETIAITALSGDEKTGTDETPSTRSPKGPATAEAVQVNSEQTRFAFMEEDSAAVMKSSKEPGRTLWIFLIHRDFKKRELRSELSRPMDMSDDGYIDKWDDRIIFPPIPFDTGDADTDNPDNPNTGNDNGGQSPEITVQIRKL
jgi:hypothetical protein